jgi:putative phage-type endonuclease
MDRTKGIGASDLAALFNLPPYGCKRQLYYEKRGVPADYAFLGNEHTRRGVMFEPFIAQLYEEDTGRKLISQGKSLKDKKHPFITCTLDYQHKDDHTPAEMKCPSLRVFRKIKQDGLQKEYILQLQQQMYLTGSEQGTAVLLCTENAELLHFDLPRDNEIIEACIEAEVAFWEKDVHGQGEGPGRLELKDARCHRCTHRSLCQGEALLSAIPEAEDGAVFDPALAPHIEEYFRAKEIRDEAKAYFEDVCEKIKQGMDKKAVVDTLGARIFYRPQETMRWDTKALGIAHPELATEFKKKSVSRPLRIYPK